jgi:hypothetical protein
MALRDRFEDNRGVLTSVAVAGAWVGLSAAFGTLGVLDWIVAAVLVGGGVLRRQTKPKPDGGTTSGIYGPPQ